MTPGATTGVPMISFFSSADAMSLESLWFYLTVYALGTIGAFAILEYLGRPEQRLEAVLRDLRRRNPRAVIFPAVEGNITFASLESLHTAWLDAHSPPPSRAPRLQPFSAAGNINHSAEGFASFCLTLPQVVSTEDIWRMVDDAGPGRGSRRVRCGRHGSCGVRNRGVSARSLGPAGRC